MAFKEITSTPPALSMLFMISVWFVCTPSRVNGAVHVRMSSLKLPGSAVRPVGGSGGGLHGGIGNDLNYTCTINTLTGQAPSGDWATRLFV